MRISRIEKNVLKHLLQAGQMRKGDFTLLISTVYSERSSVSRCVNDLLSKNLVEIKSYKVKKQNNNKTGIDEVIRLTDKGKAFITDYLDDPYYFENYKKFERKFNIRDKSELPIETDKVDRLLTDSNIEALIYAAGHPVFKNQKPSLYYLYSSIFCRASESKPGYLDNCSRAKCKEFLSKGIYYSIAEYLEFLDEISPGLPDTIYGTRARGIYLSNENCIFVYTSKKYDNKLIKINIKGERGLINSAEYLERFTEIRRVIPFLNDYGYTMEMKKYLKEAYINKPYALIISDGDMLAYATATGNAKGKIKEDTTKRTSKKLNKKDTTLLTPTASLFQRIFIVPSSLTGFYSLKYLLEHSIEDWRNDALAIIEDAPDLFQTRENTINVIPYVSKVPRGNPVFFIPVFEASYVKYLSQKMTAPIIVTYKDMVNMIARSIGCDAFYYDADLGEYLPRDTVYIFDKAGNIAGQKILDDYLKSNGRTFDKRTEGNELPKRYGMNSMAFYNAIARGELSVEDIATAVKTKPFAHGTKYYSRIDTLSISGNKDVLNAIKEAAKENEISTSKLINKLMREYLKEKEGERNE